MKRFLIIGISLLASLGLVSPVSAQEKTAINSDMVREINSISPFDLVTGSYQGRFVDQDIPSGGRFISAIRANKIHAEDLVEGAIAKGRLSEDKINDSAYLNHVRNLMNNLDSN